MVSKRIAIIAISLAACLGLLSYAVASYWVYSNQVGVTITNFAITLDTPGGSYAPGETVTFTGRLVKTGVAGLDGYRVYVDYWDGDSWEYASDGWTSGGGYFSISYVIPEDWGVGTIQFRAKASCP